MSATELIAEARAAGVRLYVVDGGGLKWTSATPPPADLLARLRENKPLLIRALEAIGHRVNRGHRDGDAERWRDLFEERAAVREFDGGLSRADAEAAALGDLAQIWQSENPPPPNDGRACAHCGKPGPCTPALAGEGGRAWLHRDCWGPMNARRRAEAEAAVRVLLGEPLC